MARESLVDILFKLRKYCAERAIEPEALSLIVTQRREWEGLKINLRQELGGAGPQIMDDMPLPYDRIRLAGFNIIFKPV